MSRSRSQADLTGHEMPHTGVNTKPDKEIYNFPAAATLVKRAQGSVERCATDAAFDALIQADQAPGGPRWLFKWERHRDNLPTDPTV